MGVGGEYPLSATVTSEGTKTHERGNALGLVFSMQGIGNVLSALVGNYEGRLIAVSRPSVLRPLPVLPSDPLRRCTCFLFRVSSVRVLKAAVHVPPASRAPLPSSLSS